MKKIVWINDSETELDEIYDFYYPLNPYAAVKIYKSIRIAVDRLKRFPMIGVVEPSLKLKGLEYTIRSFVVKGGLFKIIYYIDGDIVGIVRIWPCRKNPESF